MKIPTKRFDKTVPLPSYEDKAAGFDFICRENATIKPDETKALPGNIALKIPKGYVLLIVPRSSTANKYGLMMPHSLGVVDPFYNGSENEIVLLFRNFSPKTVQIKKGDSLAQGILIKYETVKFDETKKLGKSKVGKWSVPIKK